MRAKKVYEFMDFKRVSTGSAAEILGKAGVGKSAVTITWGKHRGKTVGEVFNEDPQYIVWLAREGRPRPGQEAVFQEVQRLADQYFKDLEAKKEAEGYGTFFGDVGDVFEGDILVKSTRYFSGDYGESFQIIGKYPATEEGKARHWIRFYANFNNLQKLFNLDPENPGIYSEIKRRAQETLPGKIIPIKGKIKGHKEWKKQNFTNLNYVKFLSTLNESQDFERGEDPYETLKIGRERLFKKREWQNMGAERDAWDEEYLWRHIQELLPGEKIYWLSYGDADEMTLDIHEYIDNFFLAAG